MLVQGRMKRMDVEGKEGRGERCDFVFMEGEVVKETRRLSERKEAGERIGICR